MNLSFGLPRKSAAPFKNSQSSTLPKGMGLAADNHRNKRLFQAPADDDPGKAAACRPEHFCLDS
jgi:hypothetical protein